MIKLDIQHLILTKYKSQAAFAEATDLSLPSVSKICSGNMASIRFETLEKICEALECTPNDLLTSDKNEWDTKFHHMLQNILIEWNISRKKSRMRVSVIELQHIIKKR